jgi:hypothetical protein
MIDEERMLDIIDRMRVAFPEELKHARRIIQERDRLLAEAQARVQQVLEEQGLLAAVEQERQQLLQQVEQEAIQVRAGADEYARQFLKISTNDWSKRWRMCGMACLHCRNWRRDTTHWPNVPVRSCSRHIPVPGLFGQR